jgi:putative transposase
LAASEEDWQGQRIILTPKALNPFLPLLVFPQKISSEDAAVGVITNSSQSPNSLPLPKPPKVEFPTLYPSFFTATCNDLLPLLQDNECKNIIMNSLRFLVEKERVRVFGFVIMSNHIHIIWQMLGDHKPEAVQRDFLKYTAQQIKFHLQIKEPQLLDKCKVQSKDRQYQIWKRNALSIDIYSEEVMIQKLNYIHLNPVKAGLVSLPEHYFFSSAAFYMLQKDQFGFISHYNGGDIRLCRRAGVAGDNTLQRNVPSNPIAAIPAFSDK